MEKEESNMSNRFNQYQNVDYVGMPLDAYAMALGAKESENLLGLQQAKSQYDLMGDIEAVHNPDRQLKEYLIGDVQRRVAELGKKNLKGSDVQLELNRIINDRTLITQLAGIQGNTMAYRSGLAANKKYEDESGNDINIARFGDEKAAYDKLGKEGFKAGFLGDYNPGKFIDITKDMHEALKMVEASGWTEDKVSGAWIHKNGRTYRDLQDLLSRESHILADPKYSKQLQNLMYYKLRPYGAAEGMKGAAMNYNQNQAKLLDEQITNTIADLASLKSKQANASDKLKPTFEKGIEDGGKLIKQLSAQRDKYLTDQDGRSAQEDLLQGIAMGGAAPFVFSKSIDEVRPNEFATINARSAAELSNWRYKHRITRGEELQDRAEMNREIKSLDAITPTVMPIFKPGTKGKEYTTAILFDGKGGLDPEKISQTILGLMNGGHDVLDENNNSVDDAYHLFKSDTPTGTMKDLRKSLAEGKVSYYYLPESKEFMIGVEGKNYTIAADLKTQQVMDPIYRLSGKDVTNVHMDGLPSVNISLDGRSDPQKMYYSRDTQGGTTDAYLPLYVQDKNGNKAEARYPLKSLNQDQYEQIVGKGFSLEQAKPLRTGIYVGISGEFVNQTNYEGKITQGEANNLFGVTNRKMLISIDELDKLKKDNPEFNLNDANYFYVDDLNSDRSPHIQPLNKIADEVGTPNFISKHFEFHTLPGNSLYNLRSDDAQKERKEKVRLKYTNSKKSTESKTE